MKQLVLIIVLLVSFNNVCRAGEAIPPQYALQGQPQPSAPLTLNKALKDIKEKKTNKMPLVRNSKCVLFCPISINCMPCFNGLSTVISCVLFGNQASTVEENSAEQIDMRTDASLEKEKKA